MNASNSVLGPTLNLYAPGGSQPVAMSAAAITNSGGSQAHLNMQPYTTISFCIALQGIFPSPT